MSETTITFKLTGYEGTVFDLSMNMSTNDFLVAMSNVDEGPEFFIGVFQRTRDIMAAWEREILCEVDGSLCPNGVVSVTPIIGSNTKESETVYFMFSTRDVYHFTATVNGEW